jgi:hypothetical protein
MWKLLEKLLTGPRSTTKERTQPTVEYTMPEEVNAEEAVHQFYQVETVHDVTEEPKETEPVEVAPEPTVEAVDDLTEVQKKLGVPQTGVFDTKTEAKVRKLQRLWGLPQTGELDQTTREKLG